MVVGNLARYESHKTELTPWIHGRYFKFIPKLWGTNSYPCIAIEMYGCGKDDGMEILS